MLHKFLFAATLLASLALTGTATPPASASAEAPELSAARHCYSVFGYQPGSSDEMLYGRYNSRSAAEDAAANAAGRGWQGVLIHRHS